MELRADLFTPSFCILYVGMLGAAILAGFGLQRAGFPIPKGPRFGSIDGLRGILALSVLSHHFWIWTHLVRLSQPWGQPGLNFANQLGAGAVGLFFMITGLVFYPTALRGIRGVYWPSLYIGRIFRIVPLVAMSFLLISLIVALRTGARPNMGYARVALEWISAHREMPIMHYADSGMINAFVLWSLWQEWIFYVFVLPLVALGLQLANPTKLPSWIVPAALLVLGLAGDAALGDRSPARFWSLFAIGMLAYELCAREPIRVWLTGRTAASIATIAMLLAVVFTPVPTGPALPAFAFLFFCVTAGNRFGGLFALPGLVVVGEISFGIYLLHGIFLNLLFLEGSALLARIPSVLLPLLMPLLGILVILVTAGTYLLIERPAWRFGKRLGNNIRPPAPAALSA